MFREKYILDNEMIKPDDQLLASLKIQMKTYAKTHEYINDTTTEDLNVKPSSVNLRLLLKYSSFAACFLVLIVSITYSGLFTGSKNSKTTQETTSAETSANSQDIAVEEYSMKSSENSGAVSDSSSRIYKEADEEAKVSIEMAPSSSLTDQKIVISKDTVTSILINKNTDNLASQQAITDSTKISDIVNYINELVLTPVSALPSLDDSKQLVMTIEYGNDINKDVIYLNEHFLKMNQNEWFELNSTDSEKLYSLIDQ